METDGRWLVRKLGSPMPSVFIPETGYLEPSQVSERVDRAYFQELFVKRTCKEVFNVLNAVDICREVSEAKTRHQTLHNRPFCVCTS